MLQFWENKITCPGTYSHCCDKWYLTSCMHVDKCCWFRTFRCYFFSGLNDTARLCLLYLRCPCLLLVKDVINDPFTDLYVQGLKSELEKSSPSLGRSAIYTKDSKINDLPRYYIFRSALHFVLHCHGLHLSIGTFSHMFLLELYVYVCYLFIRKFLVCQLTNLYAVNNRYLTVQFVRFFWKRETNQKAKILRVLFLVLNCSKKFVYFSLMVRSQLRGVKLQNGLSPKIQLICHVNGYTNACPSHIFKSLFLLFNQK